MTITSKRIQQNQGAGQTAMLLAILCTTFSFMAGCAGESATGDKRPQGSVSGKVTVSGQPVTGGAIHLTSVKTASETFGAELATAGTFTIAATIPAGSYKVSLSPPAMGPSIGPDGQMKPADPKANQSTIPEKYRSAEKSDKTVEVKVGTNSLTIDLVP